MPKVSEAHRAARREQILVAAMSVVARKGFAGVTMADVIAKSDLSAGAVYTYFESKADLFEAIGREQITEVVEMFDAELARDQVPDPVELLTRITTHVRDLSRNGVDMGVVIIQVMAETMLRGHEATAMGSRILALRSRWTEVARRMQEAGRLPADADPEDVGRVLLSLLPGFVLQSRITGPIDPHAYAAGLGALMGSSGPS